MIFNAQALLQKTTPLQSHDTTALLQQFVKNAEKLQKPVSSSTHVTVTNITITIYSY